MTSDNIAEYVGENNQFTEKPVTEYPPVIQDNTVITKDYLYSNNIDTDLLVVIGGLIVILFLMMLIMYFINSLRHKELTEILTKISFPEKSGSNSLKPEAVSCNLLSLCVLAPVFFTPRKLAEVSREIIVASAQEIAWTPGSSRIDGHQAENITWAISSQSPADKYDLINKTSRVPSQPCQVLPQIQVMPLNSLRISLADYVQLSLQAGFIQRPAIRHPYHHVKG